MRSTAPKVDHAGNAFVSGAGGTFPDTSMTAGGGHASAPWPKRSD